MAEFGPLIAVFLAGLAAGAAAVWRLRRTRPESAAAGLPITLQAVIDAVPALINCKDRDSRYVLMNAFQARLYGTTPEAAIGRTAADLLGPSYGGYTSALDRKVFDTGRPVGPYEEDYADATGKEHAWLTTKVPLRGPDGTVTHVVSVAIGISDRREVERRLLRSVDAAEQANRAKAAFLANMSHELRTPLNAVIGFGEVIAGAMFGPVGNPKYQEYARDVVESGRYLLAIIGDILDLSKIEAGRFDIVEESVDIQAMFDRCERLTEGRARRGGVALRFEAPADLPMLRGDQRALTQVLVNIIANAVKFTPNGGSVAVTAELRDDGSLTLAIADTGIGMAEADIRKALRPFEQLDRGWDKKYEGTGLGLPIAKGLVERHGGRLEIASAVDRGTTVTIWLPAERVLSDALILQAAQAG